MKPWERIDTTLTPDGSRLELWHHDGEWVIRAEGYDLMSSRQHGSEDALMAIACPRPPAGARVLVGGLGLGFTLASVLRALPADGRVVVAEIVPDVVRWNRERVGHCAGHPLDDPRTEVAIDDVAAVIRAGEGRFDAILLDVDNGPDAFSQRGNDRIYSPAGLEAIRRALRPGGAVAIWSLGPVTGVERRLRRAGLDPSTARVPAHGERGRRHTVFVGRRSR